MGIIPHFAIVAHEIGHAMMPRIGLNPVNAAVRAETAAIMARLATLGVATPIGQLFFHSVQFAASSQTEVPGIGQYGGVIDLLPRRISSEVTRTKIAALKAKNGLR
jgi:hypothetical protein